MDSKGIVTRPDSDTVTEYFYEWFFDVISFASSRNVRLIDLDRDKATRVNLESYLDKNKALDLVFLNGHGETDRIFGQHNEPLVIAGQNHAILDTKIIHVLACCAGKNLGRYCVEKGNARAFIGYEYEFAIVTDKHSECKPRDDPVGNIFKIPAISVPLSLLEGKNVDRAIEIARQKYLQLIRKFSASDADPLAKDIRFWLYWNMECLSVYGDGSASVNLS